MCDVVSFANGKELGVSVFGGPLFTEPRFAFTSEGINDEVDGTVVGWLLKHTCQCCLVVVVGSVLNDRDGIDEIDPLHASSVLHEDTGKLASDESSSRFCWLVKDPGLEVVEAVGLSLLTELAGLLIVAVFLAVIRGLFVAASGNFQMSSISDGTLGSAKTLALLEDDEALQVGGTGIPGLSAIDEVLTFGFEGTEAVEVRGIGIVDGETPAGGLCHDGW